MKKISLEGMWNMQSSDGTKCSGKIPGSVYSFLLENKLMEDPFYRDNELKALAIMGQDYTFSRDFSVEQEMLAAEKLILRCDGLDTICEISINGKATGSADNMHRIWEFDIHNLVQAGTNTITLFFPSPTKWITDMDQKDYVGGSYHAMKGFPHMRKAHCMFGWDWGPRLPDAGIWREISLLVMNSSRIEDVYIRQQHENETVYLTTNVVQSENAEIKINIQTPDGKLIQAQNKTALEIIEPQLWWPNGYGEQPLYIVTVELYENNELVDSQIKKIGLRTMTVIHEKDQWGSSFEQNVNGVSIFAMGADYIPEDNIFSRITPDRTRKLLEQCVRANFNSIRVWGGGYYPDDFFFDLCDELGLVVWQDFMFACSNYHLTEDFEKNIRAEFADNIKRIRHHASLGLWCGNNEMEMFSANMEYDGNHLTQADYIKMFEYIIPSVLKELDPDTFYWPASPSSGGNFDAPNDPDRGDVHYWDVWHGNKPFDDYRNYYFRYASEFGFQAFPGMKTIESFTLPEDRNIFSRVMEMHQRNEGANGKIMNYLSQTYLYPTSFEALLYASQLLQAEAIRYGVEHWRRNRGRCMGAVYWQLNDIWPVASWASVDYFMRWKALHYFAKRFFSPIMISCEEIGETTDRVSVVMEPSKIETSGRLNVANETRKAISGTVKWSLRDNTGKILREGERKLSIPALSSVWLDKEDFGCTNFLENYMSYSFESDGMLLSSGTVLFTAPKHFQFLDPQLDYEIQDRKILVSAKAYAKSVEILSPDCDLVLSDNYFDLDAGCICVDILEGEPKKLSLRSVYDIK